MEKTTVTGRTDEFGNITGVVEPSRNTIHLFVENGSGPIPDLPDSLDAPEGRWNFTAPLTRGAVLLPDGVADDFPCLEIAFEELDQTTVRFPIQLFTRCMLNLLHTDGPYQTAEELVEAYYQYDMGRGEYSAPELCHEQFNELHVEGRLDLSESTAYAIHAWITNSHPEYDLFLPARPPNTHDLTPLKTH